MRHDVTRDDPKPKNLLSPAEFHDRFNGVVGKNSIYEAIKSNRIKHVKLGRKILILASEVEDWPHREAERGTP
jgi:excisionase family DNA binding protein